MTVRLSDPMGKTDYASNHFVSPSRPDVIPFSRITDGLSATLMAGEKAFDPTVQTPTSWYWDEAVWIGGSFGTSRNGRRIISDGAGIAYRNHWGSPHLEVTHFVFCVGHVESISNSMDEAAIFESLTPSHA